MGVRLWRVPFVWDSGIERREYYRRLTADRSRRDFCHARIANHPRSIYRRNSKRVSGGSTDADLRGPGLISNARCERRWRGNAPFMQVNAFGLYGRSIAAFDSLWIANGPSRLLLRAPLVLGCPPDSVLMSVAVAIDCHDRQVPAFIASPRGRSRGRTSARRWTACCGRGLAWPRLKAPLVLCLRSRCAPLTSRSTKALQLVSTSAQGSAREPVLVSR